MDFKLLADALTTALAPAMPYLAAGGQEAARGAGKKIGEEGLELAKKLWEKVGSKVKRSPQAEGAANDLAAAPDEQDVRAALRLQLREILESHPELASELAKIVETDPAALRDSYLSRVFQRAEVLTFSGIDPLASAAHRDAKLRLDLIYTALVARTPEEADLKRAALMPGTPELPALALLDLHARLVLLGDSGSGKSTFVSFVALCLAGEALGRSEANLTVLRAPLPTDNECEVNPQPWRHKALLPVRVILGELAARSLPAAGEKATAKHFWDFLKAELSGLGEYFPFLKKELLERGGLVMLDGLDEVPEAENRRVQILHLVEDVAAALPRCRLLLTSRTYAYRNQDWSLPGFEEAELAPFSENQITAFVRRWYGRLAALGRFPPETAAGMAELLLREIFSSERLSELAERPLLLTLMTSLHASRGGTLPERREELYADAVKLLLCLWENQRAIVDAQGRPISQQRSLAEFLKIGEETVRSVLEELACEAHGSQPDARGTADIAQARLVDRLMAASRNPEVKPALLIEYLRDRAGLLEPRGVGVYTFPHLSFQEYLAACHLTGESFPDRIAELARSDPERWREVVLLAGAKAARGAYARMAVWALADALCWRAPDDTETESSDVWGAHLAAQVVAESANLADVSPANRAKLKRLQSWLVRILGDSRLPARERALAGRTLAVLGDPRHGVMTVDGMEFRTVPAGRFWMGSRAEDPAAFGDEIPRHEVELAYEYRIARFPVTVAQFREYLEASMTEFGDAAALRGQENGPMVRVSWFEAISFCRWLTERWRTKGLLEARWSVCLPSEAEWEKAARGQDGWTFPWGDDFDPEQANCTETGLGLITAVGCFPGGASWCGCEDMSGNVLEWNRSVYNHYPYDPTDGRENFESSGPSLRALRGGSFFNYSWYARCAGRGRLAPGYRGGDVGFRVVLSPGLRREGKVPQSSLKGTVKILGDVIESVLPAEAWEAEGPPKGSERRKGRLPPDPSGSQASPFPLTNGSAPLPTLARALLLRAKTAACRVLCSG